MTAQTSAQTVSIVSTPRRAHLWRQIALMTWRNLLTLFHAPEALLPPLGISIFFLIIYESPLQATRVFAKLLAR